ncbi:MAG: PepSY domain-containing protein [Alphaproteobacteria bacterium]
MKAWIAVLTVLMLASGGAVAGADHERARRAVEEGRILPLRDILAKAQQSYPGQVVEAELEDEDGRFIYEIKILSSDGRVMKLLFDAQKGDLLKARGRPDKR